MLVADGPVIQYRVDAADRFIAVNPAWVAEAEADGRRELLPPGILGRSLWDAIGDPTAQHLYAALLERVRAGAGPVSLVFRCDTPAQRRLLRLRIAPSARHGIDFEARFLAVKDRAPVALLDRAAPRSGALIRICAWCKRVPLPDGPWVEVEEAMDRLDLLDAPPLPRLTHGICPACQAALDAAPEHPPSPEPSDLVLGDRLPPPT
jgi:hypothetical protein